MSLKADVLIAGAPQRVTQRGNCGQRNFFKDEDSAANLLIAAAAYASNHFGSLTVAPERASWVLAPMSVGGLDSSPRTRCKPDVVA